MNTKFNTIEYTCVHTRWYFMKKIFALLADDHDIFLDGLEKTIQTITEIEIIGKASRGNDVIHKLASVPVDLLILDINLPQKDGVEVMEYIQKTGLCTKVLVLSYYNDYTIIKKMLDMGVLSYVSKDAGRDELCRAVVSVMAGKHYLPDSIKAIIKAKEVKKDTHDDFVSKYNLTKREIEIMTEIARELTTVEIADKLCLSEYTVETYRKSIIKKLDAKNVASLVNIAHRWGLI